MMLPYGFHTVCVARYVFSNFSFVDIDKNPTVLGHEEIHYSLQEFGQIITIVIENANRSLIKQMYSFQQRTSALKVFCSCYNLKVLYINGAFVKSPIQIRKESPC